MLKKCLTVINPAPSNVIFTSELIPLRATKYNSFGKTDLKIFFPDKFTIKYLNVIMLIKLYIRMVSLNLS